MGRILAGNHAGAYLLKFEGDVRLTLSTTIDRFLDAMFDDADFCSVVIDINGAASIDSTALGLLARLSIRAQEAYGFVPLLYCENPNLLRLLDSMGFSDVFEIVHSQSESAPALSELPMHIGTQEQTRSQVLAAHRTLMDMNHSNRLAFQDLVQALEDEAKGVPPSSSADASTGG